MMRSNVCYICEDICDFIVGCAKFVFWVAVVVGLPVFVIHSCVTSEWYQRQQAAERAAKIADAKPRVINETPDGCKVYAFRPQDRWLYFTRCPNSQTTTNNAWSVTTQNGKTSSTHTESMDIKTAE